MLAASIYDLLRLKPTANFVKMFQYTFGKSSLFTFDRNDRQSNADAMKQNAWIYKLSNCSFPKTNI